jgi:hypothetical protein
VSALSEEHPATTHRQKLAASAALLIVLFIAPPAGTVEIPEPAALDPATII